MTIKTGDGRTGPDHGVQSEAESRVEPGLEPAAEPEARDLDELRLRRAELLESITALEQALAAPTLQERWGERVCVALLELSSDFREHIELTEGASGLYSRVIRFSPRLNHSVDRLTKEHDTLTELIEGLIAMTGPAVVPTPNADADVVPGSGSGIGNQDEVRERGNSLLGALARHRQRGADLVYEAYSVDIGGQD